MRGFVRTLIAPVIAAVIAASAAQGAFYQWSKTAATNATADPSINWAEGMSPSSVNDSARAMMARAAEYRDDISGMLATGGTSLNYTVTTNQVLPSTPNDGQLLAITVHATNAADPALAADGGTAFPIRTGAGGALGAGTLVAGSSYTMRFSVSANAWVLRDFYGTPYSIPLGAVILLTGDTVPNSNFVFAIGQCISRTTYAAYFALVGTRFGACDGVSTFGVPDLRERGVAFQGTMGGAASPGRITSAGSGCDATVVGTGCGAQNRTIAQANLPAATLTTTIGAGQGSHVHGPFGAATGFYGPHPAASFAVIGGAGTNAEPTTGTATLPAMSGTTPLGGSGTALQTLTPMLILTAVVRIF